MSKFALIILVTSTLIACAPQTATLYHWGSYESLVNEMYVNPATADASTQIAKLTEDLEAARNLGKSPPPGLHAHLGMLYAIIGNEAQSRVSFENEKLLYPESIQLIDGMIARAEKNIQATSPVAENETSEAQIENQSDKIPVSMEETK